jgi:hypothetical protein
MISKSACSIGYQGERCWLVGWRLILNSKRFGFEMSIVQSALKSKAIWNNRAAKF